ncbi:NAD(P)H-dependent oxidoreductase [Bosea sp. (in: a-proteobacteria)]|jgi:chromate reductase|uniref:NADPH-dependent FMN reductase n=1 Tax=Bosea sp. (in: a-proteobacteria) TaxID=1871050 RepID=UPI002DDCF116|nr:NAD(P)H-dependent oxidoreductase [Bosea sp. (in: a-proteobacteria)]HEV2508409.1 NAD(P)H-dependent oxidoreductase [Bosea sp. (in: a-proteobacteria)]
MLKPRIALLVGSLSRESINRRLGEALQRLGSGRFEIRDCPLADLPLFNRDLDSALPESVRRFKAEIEAADGILIVGPEYNRSVSSVLKNAIDWGSRPYGANSWKDKPAAIAGLASGALGTAPAQQHLRNILSHLDMHVLPQPEVCMAMRDGLFDAAGDIADETAKRFLEGFLSRFAAHVGRFGKVAA